MTELEEIDAWIGDVLEDTLGDVIEIAMNRCQIKKSRRPHTRLVIEEAFKVILEREKRNQ